MTDDEEAPVMRSGGVMPDAALPTSPTQGPMPGTSWFAEQRARLDLEEREAEQRATRGLLASVREIAQRQVEAFASLPCLGDIDRIEFCIDEWERKCDRRLSPSCPRQIMDFDRRRQRNELLERLRGSGVPQDAIDALNRDFFPTKGTAAVDAFLADGQKRTLVIAGDVGLGKSVAAAYAIRRHPGRFVTCSQVVELGRFGKGGEERKRATYETPLLVVDDLGMEYADAKGWFQSLIEPLLVERHNQGRRTIVTCNVDLKTFATRYGARIADRISGSGMFVQLDGPSLRGPRGI